MPDKSNLKNKTIILSDILKVCSSLGQGTHVQQECRVADHVPIVRNQRDNSNAQAAFSLSLFYLV